MSHSELKSAQLAMAAHLRNPAGAPPPKGIEERRLKVYRDLVYNNVEGFIRGGFPVLCSLYDDMQWEELVRAFMDRHRCRSPYFLEISQEFIGFLLEEHQPRPCDPPFMAELAHYEWVELALDVAEAELPETAVPEQVPPSVLTLSPLAWVLHYQFPVHEIGPGYRPETADVPTFLAVYRNSEDQVKFMVLNAATARLLELMRDNTATPFSDVVGVLAQEMNRSALEIAGFATDEASKLLAASVLIAVPGA